MPETKKIFLATNVSNTSNEDLVKMLDNFEGLTVISTDDEDFFHFKLTEILLENKSCLCISSTLKTDIDDAIYLTFTNDRISNAKSLTVDSNMIIRFMKLAQFYNTDIGSLKKSQSTDSKESCAFCTAGVSFGERLFYQTPNFNVLVGLGCFQKGYLIITPRQHISSFSKLDMNQLKEFDELSSYLRHILNKVYKFPVISWEHSKSDHHAHVHMIPTSVNVLNKLESNFLPVEQIDLSELEDYTEKEYLSISPNNGLIYILSRPNFYIPKYFIKKLLFEHSNIPLSHLNWRSYPYTHFITQTLYDLSVYRNVR